MSGSECSTIWYTDGLRFTCTQCGACCGGAPGHVWVSLEECDQIAAYLGLTCDDFTKRHVRRVGVRLSLLEKKGGDCELLVREQSGRTKCAIHPVRPLQCRTWPIWPSNLATPEDWREAASECPGINQGKHHPLSIIQAVLRANGDLPL